MSRIVFDAGHGGADSGASGSAPWNHVREADLAWALTCLAAAKAIELGHKTPLTRPFFCYSFPAPGSSDFPMKRRDGGTKVDWLARRVPDQADALVSVHLNGFSSPQASGFEILYHPASDPGRRLGEILLEGLREEIGELSPERGLKPREGLALLNRANTSGIPAALVEPAFVTSPADLAWIGRFEHQLSVATAIANGVDRFVRVGRS